MALYDRTLEVFRCCCSCVWNANIHFSTKKKNMESIYGNITLFIQRFVLLLDVMNIIEYSKSLFFLIHFHHLFLSLFLSPSLYNVYTGNWQIRPDSSCMQKFTVKIKETSMYTIDDDDGRFKISKLSSKSLMKLNSEWNCEILSLSFILSLSCSFTLSLYLSFTKTIVSGEQFYYVFSLLLLLFFSLLDSMQLPNQCIPFAIFDT